MTEIEIAAIQSNEAPGVVLNKHFGLFLPIWGGWGYSKESAVVIDREHPIVNPDRPFDGVGIEYVFVENRIKEELRNAQPEGQKFKRPKWKLLNQKVLDEDDRRFDVLTFEVEVTPVGADAEPLVWEEEFWFDITKI